MTWAITGTGLVSSLGAGVEESFAAFCRGGSGLHPLRAFDASRYRVRSAYEIPDRTDGRDLPGRPTRWLCEVVGQALAQAGLAGAAHRDHAPRMPVVVGTGLAEQRSLELWWTAGVPLSPDRLDFAGAVAEEFGLPETVTLVNACSAGLYALAVAADLLALDEADAVMVAATDALSESMFGLLDRVNTRPPHELRPFDVDRRGVVLGEGAAAVVVEPLHRARSRGAVPLALLRAVGTACDAHHVTAPLPAGVARAFRDAYTRAGTAPADINLVMAHGTGTVLNDETEALALRDAFAPAAGRPLVTALKSLIGHTSGASGLVSLVTAIAALHADTVPPTLHCATPIAALDGFHLVTDRAAPAALRTAQVNAFGFGGVNAVAVLDRLSPGEPARAGESGASVADRHRPVAITGVGLEVPGIGPIDDLLAGRRSPAGFDPRATLGRRGLRYKDRASTLALCAAAHALADAGLPGPVTDDTVAESFGVVVSSMLATAGTVCRVADTIHGAGTTATSPMDLPNVSGNAAAASIAIWFQLAGLNLTVAAGPSSGIAALHLAATAIRAGRARRMLVVGVEPADEVVTRLLGAAIARDGGSGSRPGRPPFDGAGAVVLEAGDVATARGARVLGMIGERRHDARLEAALPRPDGDAQDAPGLWMVPCLGHAGAADRVAAVGSTRWPGARTERVDLSATTGEASGALGVVQCVAAARWLGGHPDRAAVLTAGGCWGEDFASLVLRGTR